ncbi:MAG: hypothetical protein AB1782_05470 [Cyanobacteriota bacterium]
MVNIYAMQNSYLFQQQKQQQIAQQMEKYNNSLSEYNMEKVIKFYTQAINSAESSNEAKYLAESLNSLLSNYGKSIDDVKGINNPLLTDPAATTGGKGKQRGNAQDKAVIKDLSDEFGIDVKKRGTTQDWLEKAKTDDRVRVLDSNGKDVTNEREGRIKNGDILEVKSEKHGLVKIAVGGDGEINGGDDKVIAMGGKTAANGIFHGLNEINTLNQEKNLVAGGGNGIATNLFNKLNPEEELLNPETNTTQIFTQNEIKNLLAAILNTALSDIEKKEYQKQIQQIAV